jgi:type I restriction enzyme M protein
MKRSPHTNFPSLPFPKPIPGDLNLANWVHTLGFSHIDIQEGLEISSKDIGTMIVDIAVFESGKPHLPENIKYVVDCSSRDEETVLKRFKNLFHLLPNAIGGIWHMNNLLYFYANDHGIPAPVPAFSKLADNSLKSNKSPMHFTDLSGILWSLHNYIYANEGHSASEAFSEIMKLLFIKIEDENKNGYSGSRQFFIDSDEFRDSMAGKKSQPVESFASRIGNLFEKAKKDYPSLFRDSEAINLKVSTLAFAVSKLQAFNLADFPADVKGTAFQKIVGSTHRGSRGQFFTPEPVVKLMVRFLRPQPDEIIMDPACGTGGFLIEALRFMRTNPHCGDSFQTNLFGVEINPAVARVAMMQMILFGGNANQIICSDSLANEDFPISLGDESVDVIITNPPFGSQGKIELKSLLGKYELGHRWEKSDGEFIRTDNLLSGQVPDILFIERCLRWLRRGGRMGIVLPNGDLENISLKYVRHFIRQQAHVLAVVSLPQETFLPFGTGVKASVLFLEKKRDNELSDRKVFFGVINRIGYGGGKHSSPSYLRDSQGQNCYDASGLPVIDEDVSNVIRYYEEYLDKGSVMSSSNSFFRKLEELKDRLDATYYMPEYDRLEEILKEHGAMPLKSLVRIKLIRSKKLKDPSASIRYVELSDVNVAVAEIYNATTMKVYEAPSRAAYDVKEGDIITAVSGNSTGTTKHATAYITKEYDGCICSNGFRVIKATHVDPLYLLCYMRTGLFLKQIFQHRTGAAIPAISDADLKEILVLLPPAEVQKRIADLVRRSMELRIEALDYFLSATSDEVFNEIWH